MAVTDVDTPSDIRAGLEQLEHPVRVNHLVIGFGSLAWIVFALVTWGLPNSDNLPMSDAGGVAAMTAFTAELGIAVAVLGLIAWGLTRVDGHLGSVVIQRVIRGGPWFLAAALWGIFWEFTTAKIAILAPPYFDSPQAIINSLSADQSVLWSSLGHSLLLLFSGFAVGTVAGLITGTIIGWYQVANYWVHPILVIIGPVPALTWVPIVFVLFPTTYSGAVFMIALSVWFPITILTRAGILSVPRSYFDVAQTLGARGWFLVLRVSLPGALPSIFTGGFMALGAAFVSLTVAENFGVSSGLGWYINYMKSFGNFPGLYAGVIVLIAVCSIALSILFRARNYVLRWEKELTRW